LRNGFPRSPYATLLSGNIAVSSKIRALPYGTLSQTLNVKKIRTPTIGERDIKSDSRQFAVDSTWQVATTAGMSTFDDH